MGFYSRLYHTVRLVMIRRGTNRAKYLKRKNVFGHIGENVMIMPRKIPLYPELIKLNNNVRIASNVKFITHDDIHSMLNNADLNKCFDEKIGCIEVGNNVFIGSDTSILYDVKIGDNVIIAAGSIVNKDIPANSVVAGIPAKEIGVFEDYVNRRKQEHLYPEEIKLRRQNLTESLQEYMWNEFYDKRKDRS